MGFPSRRRVQQVALPLVMPALALLGDGRGRFLTGLTSFLAQWCLADGMRR